MPHAPILLHEPDLGESEAAAVRAALAGGAWRDAALTRAWEEAWSQAWQREAVAFAEVGELVGVLKTLLGWRSGEEIALSPLLEPGWREALAQHWLTPRWLEVEPVSGQVRLERADPTQAALLGHAYGLPFTPPPGQEAGVLEVISDLPLPRPGSGWGRVQVALLDGNALPCAGGSCMLLSQDAALMDGARRLRQHPPGAAACALGLAQWQRLPEMLARRARQAERYLALRTHGVFALPGVPERGREWGRFVLTMATPEGREVLHAFLEKSAILAGAPVWWRLDPQAALLPGVVSHLERALALPLHAGLDEPGQKRIINRIHRWAERCSQP